MKKIVFLTGTRADFGKLKPLICAVNSCDQFQTTIFATGMHLLSRYGMTVDEIRKAGLRNIFTYMNQVHGEPMEMVLANTIGGFSRYVHEYNPDLIIVHGDRVETLAGATVGALRNILVGHVEGGELSGTVDEVIRHAVTKLAHLHFVANNDAKKRLLQLGECDSSISVIGSPDVDIMLSGELPSFIEAKKYYEIDFERYGLVLYHSVTTEPETTKQDVRAFVSALLDSKGNYVVIFPNNDPGSEIILQEYQRMNGKKNFRIFPSLRFEFFLTLLKHADYIIGNSSAGIHEAPVFGVPTVNVGTRQQNRFIHHSIVNVIPDIGKIQQALEKARSIGRFEPCNHFGSGNSAKMFRLEIQKESFWATSKQKVFQNIPPRREQAE